MCSPTDSVNPIRCEGLFMLQMMGMCGGDTCTETLEDDIFLSLFCYGLIKCHQVVPISQCMLVAQSNWFVDSIVLNTMECALYVVLSAVASKLLKWKLINVVNYHYALKVSEQLCWLLHIKSNLLSRKVTIALLLNAHINYLINAIVTILF